MEELYHAGKIRAIGVSNFLPHHIENLMQNAKVTPAVDQLEYHPGYTQQAAVDYCRKNQILVEAWSPIGRRRVFEEPLILELSEKYHVSPAQICLRFALQNGVIPMPKSSSMERMKENQDIFHLRYPQKICIVWRQCLRLDGPENIRTENGFIFKIRRGKKKRKGERL